MTTHTFVLAMHLLGCAFGIGASTMLDLRVLQLLSGRRVSAGDVAIAQLLGWFVRGGLALLWCSGLCFLALYWFSSPELLVNPKLHAKIVIVLTLTLNGLIIEFAALPTLMRQQGYALFDGWSRQAQAGALIVGAVSATSWYGAFALGICRELNFTVPHATILAVYAGMLTLSFCAAVLARHAFYRPDRRTGGQAAKA